MGKAKKERSEDRFSATICRRQYAPVTKEGNKKMKWGNLKENKCPKCGEDLCQSTIKKDVFECANGISCGFSISTKRFSEIVNSQVIKGLTKDWENEQEDDQL